MEYGLPHGSEPRRSPFVWICSDARAGDRLRTGHSRRRHVRRIQDRIDDNHVGQQVGCFSRDYVLLADIGCYKTRLYLGGRHKLPYGETSRIIELYAYRHSRRTLSGGSLVPLSPQTHPGISISPGDGHGADSGKSWPDPSWPLQGCVRRCMVLAGAAWRSVDGPPREQDRALQPRSRSRRRGAVHRYTSRSRAKRAFFWI